MVVCYVCSTSCGGPETCSRLCLVLCLNTARHIDSDVACGVDSLCGTGSVRWHISRVPLVLSKHTYTFATGGVALLTGNMLVMHMHDNLANSRCLQHFCCARL
jgi:hypothetical protein